MKDATFSIVTPTLNGARYLEQTINSVLDQDYPRVEYFVQDGAGSDRTPEILARYDSRLTGSASQPDRGQADAINRAFSRTTGEFLAWINADDFYEPGALRHVAELFGAHPYAAAIVGAAWMAFPDGTRTLRGPLDVSPSGLLNWRTNWIAQPAVFFRRSAWQQVGPLDESLHWAMDLDLWLRLVQIGPFIRTDRVLASFREHPAAKTFAGSNRMREETRRVLLRHASHQELKDLFATQHREMHRLDDVCANLIVEHVRRRCAELEGDVALYGAGAHTPWLLGVLAGRWRARVTAILDDNARPNQRIANIPVTLPQELSHCPSVIILSTDTLQPVLATRCRELFGNSALVVDLYEGLPPGSYPKSASHRAGWETPAHTTPTGSPAPPKVDRSCRTPV